jgi:hypothetical protein
LAASRLAQLRGDVTGALQALQPVLAAYADPGDPAALARGDSTLAQALRRRAELRLATGDAAAALADAEASRAIAERLQAGRPHALRTGQAWAMVARARAALGQDEEARRAARQALAHLDAMRVDAADADAAFARQLSRD